MNIWYISKYASPAKYFFGTRHFYLAEEWVKSGNDVTVITSNSSHLSTNLPKFNKSYLIEYVNGVRAYWLNTFKSTRSSSITRIISWFHFDFKLLFISTELVTKPDVIIVSSLSLTTVLPAWFLSKKYNSKFIFEIRDIWPLSIIVLGGYSKFNPFIIYLSWLEKFGYKKADLIVGTIPNLSLHIKENCDINKSCICIPQGFNSRFYETEQKLISENYKKKYLPINKFIICYAGTINVNNSLDNLVEAVKILEKDDRIHFLILGDGDLKNYYEELTKNLKNITFIPKIPKNQVNDLLGYVNVCYDCIDSKLGKYGMSRNKWIDYMYASKPIICSYDGYQSMINEANCGTFVKYNDVNKLVEVIQHYANTPKSVLTEMGERAKKFVVDNRNFERLANIYLTEIKNI